MQGAEHSPCLPPCHSDAAKLLIFVFLKLAWYLRGFDLPAKCCWEPAPVSTNGCLLHWSSIWAAPVTALEQGREELDPTPDLVQVP